jgi:hypothetical protein
MNSLTIEVFLIAIKLKETIMKNGCFHNRFLVTPLRGSPHCAPMKIKSAVAEKGRTKEDAAHSFFESV